jgi:hypothetical protein
MNPESGGDFAVVMLLFMIAMILIFVVLAGAAGNAGIAIPTAEPFWPPHNAF